MAAQQIFYTWRRWLARRAGPLLWFREESNNPYDFFTSDPVTDMPLRDVVSFVDNGKGYIMDVKSATSLLEFAARKKEPALNPFNRAPLPPLFLRRLARHTGVDVTTAAIPPSDSLTVTDLFRVIEDLGYYTDPDWILTLSRPKLQCLYIEMCDIWNHRAGLTASDRARIVPPPTTAVTNRRYPFITPVVALSAMPTDSIRRMILGVCRQLITASAIRGDRQLGVLYILGALTIVSSIVGEAYPWMAEMFRPGVTRLSATGSIHITNPEVLNY